MTFSERYRRLKGGWSHRRICELVSAVRIYVDADQMFDSSFDSREWQLTEMADDQRKRAVKEFYRILGETEYDQL